MTATSAKKPGPPAGEAGSAPAAPIRPPTPLSRKFVRYLVGFGVGVAIGLAPYLGIVNVPLFRALLDLIPDTIHHSVIPLSAAMMGTIAVVIQYNAQESISHRRLRTLFFRTLVTAIVAFVLLAIVHSFFVRTLPAENNRSLSFLVGFTRPNADPCLAGVSDEECIALLSADPSKIKSFWGNKPILVAQLSLTFTYLLFTGAFGTLVGLLLLKESKIEQQPTRAKRTQRKRKVAPVAGPDPAVSEPPDHIPSP